LQSDFLVVGIWVDSNDNIFFSDFQFSCIRMVKAMDSQISLIAGSPFGSDGYQDGIGTDALFTNPKGIHGNDQILIVVDFRNNAIRKIDLTSFDYTVSTIVKCADNCYNSNAANPYIERSGDTVHLSSPMAPFIDGNYVYFTDESIRVIFRTDLSSPTYTTKIIYGQWFQPSTIFSPKYLYVTSKGLTKSIYVSDLEPWEGKNSIQRLDLSADQNSVSFVELVAGLKTGSEYWSPDGVDARMSPIYSPQGIWVDEDKNLLYYAEGGLAVVRTVDMSHDYIIKTFAGTLNEFSDSGDGGPATSATIISAWAIFSRNSKFYISEVNNSRKIRKVETIAGPPGNGNHNRLRRG
jgi:outer membrane lipoprotein-sorting protein